MIGARRKSAQHRFRTLAVEAEPVDDRLVAREPKHARTRIAGLGQRRDRAHLDETEAPPQQRIGHLPMLVEPCRHPHGIGKVETEGAHCKAGVIRRELDKGR